jgi:16S rRNA (cytosine967-C5)-methyltransferase|uniref:SAM-dependent MTase RsmB/NOP-type domain-containing protein n=1 Tax=Mesoaciditoga lauensis TaxID=1495039 RepID=A0A7V3REF8_9BACT
MKARKIALEILKEGISNFFVSKSSWKKAEDLSSEDRAFVRKLVYGTLRYSISLDKEIDIFLKNPRATPDEIRDILRMGTYEIVEMRVPAYATVNEYTKIASNNFKGLVNAVLRRISENSSRIDLGSGLPQWLLDLLRKDLKDDFNAFLKKAEYHEISVRAVGRSRDELKKEFEDQNIESYPMNFSPYGLKCPNGIDLNAISAFEKGHFTFQDESSQMVGISLKPEAGEKILDAFGGVGTKTTHLIQMEPEALIYYNDLNKSKISVAEDNFRRLRLSPYEVMNVDILNGSFDRKFDKILVDAPCTALGTLGKHPDLLLRIKPQDVASKSEMQIEMINKLWNVLVDGGMMIYSVCTVTKSETDGVISKFLADHLEARAVNPFEKDFNFEFNGYGVQLLNLMEGFYISKIIKNR